MGILRRKLVEEEEMLRRQNASYVFYPTEIKVDAHQMKMLLTGDRFLFSAGQQVSSEKESYILSFSYLGSRLLLKEIISKEKSEEER